MRLLTLVALLALLAVSPADAAPKIAIPAQPDEATETHDPDDIPLPTKGETAFSARVMAGSCQTFTRGDLKAMVCLGMMKTTFIINGERAAT